MRQIYKYTKIILNILFLFIITLIPFSCNKFLEQSPTGEQTKEFIFQDYLRAQRYMDNLYYNLPPLWETRTRIGGYGFLESATDMAEYTANYGTANTTFNVGDWKSGAASEEVSTPWKRGYDQLRICYMTLENLDQFNNEPKDESGNSRKLTMKGEIHFMIGFYYFDMLKRYGGLPLVKSILDLNSDLKIPRASYDETKDYIIENLDKAIELLPEIWSSDNFGRVTKIAAMALKSRVLLYAASPLNNQNGDKKRWLEAANAARDVIDICEKTNHHSLYHDYQNLFMRGYSEERPEIIMPKLIGTGTITFLSSIISYGQATPGEGFRGYGSNSPTQNFVDRFEVIVYDPEGNPIETEPFNWNNPDHVNNIYKNRDPRFYYTVIFNDLFWIKRKIETWRDGNTYGKDINPKDHLYTRTGYYMRKYWPRECQDYIQVGAATLSTFYIRFGEILLNYAECMNELYGPDKDELGREKKITAREAVNQIRARLVCPPSEEISGTGHPYYRVKQERDANPDFPVLKNGLPGIKKGLSQDLMREKIHNERIIELCFEDHYLYDILRWMKGPELMGSPVYGVDIIKNGNNFTYKRIKVEERVFDSSRMYLYPIPTNDVYSMSIQQNPGW
ncbi:MAG: RagB/SusD family nutrient uptake outer membrane protein [Bacteroidales bacterium]|jgi:hypothetical protein|nr:RagB/SusD family nutrient uptake outer membrane protein [Bacteroidales bacterium]MDD2263867.1 RagB/SusD family nutrient uptake outer membrane protein [Bacteroidales bacterium]MDD2830916.1 RagB/SusD family nutrient uptake outer membrane protein [Bacteroidales bacterium]MDD3208276.1 RagB/SusD family nutrient uptake outer membrane protein [Bacteroidales bacterium]MDD3696682.1 RagB/SusD family nutrient uptake outer membrane protein [Bacteroidales bacterium]